MNDRTAIGIPPATILIVDDEIKNRKLLEVLLRHQGYRTVSVGNGDEALALIERDAPDLILLDVMMPTLDGYQVARILKAHPRSLNIPIIMVSSQGDRTARLAGLNAGAEEFLGKPIDRDELWLRVRNLLRLKAYADLVRNNTVILEQRVHERTLELQRFSIAMDATDDALMLIDRASMRFIEVNLAASRLLGHARDDMLGASAFDVMREPGLEQCMDAIIAGSGPEQPRETRWQRCDGSEIAVEVSLHAVQTGEDWTIVSVGRDITERKRTEAKLKQLAHYDALTGLPNRRLFQDALVRAMEQASALDMQVVLIYLDIDHFKDVNDTLGHPAGDELLRGMGKRLLEALYARDCVGRLGGDEFGIVLLTPRGSDVAMKVAEKVHAVLCPPFELSGSLVPTSASIGIALYPGDAEDAAGLARYADMAMYEAKRAGRNTSRFYTASMNQRAGERVKLVAALRDALERGEFVLHYQPKVSLQTGDWTGTEALLRWQRPGHGLVPPSEFIPALEESGLVVAVGTWIIGEACRQLAAWRDAGMGRLPVAVNVSALQIAHVHPAPGGGAPDGSGATTVGVELLSAISDAMHRYGIPPGWLEVEITESVVMADAKHSVDVLERLRGMGVSLSVDDFGTGYSSLSYLRRLPLAAVKIDGSFVRDVTTSAEDASIAVAIIEMAHRLKLRVIAECVETAEQTLFLQAHECDEAQGFHFAPPMPAAALEALWRSTGGGFADRVANAADERAAEIFSDAWPECRLLVGALLASRHAESVGILEAMRSKGQSLEDIHHQLIMPALYCIGEKWRSREVSIAQEHLATALALRVMAEVLPRSPKAEPNGRKVLLACVQGNRHAVGLQMLSDAFTLAGWTVHSLGESVSAEVLIEHTLGWKPDIIGLSIALPEHVQELAETATLLRAALPTDCPPVLVGGQGCPAVPSPSGELHGAIWACDPQSGIVAAERALEARGSARCSSA